MAVILDNGAACTALIMLALTHVLTECAFSWVWDMANWLRTFFFFFEYQYTATNLPLKFVSDIADE